MTRSSASTLALTMTLGLGLVACVPQDAGLSSVLPDDRILINLPTDSASAKDLSDEQWSPAYLFTAKVTDDVNSLIGGVLVLVDVITDLPPSYVDGDTNHALWGPYADALDPVETSLFVQHDVEADTYTWAFVQRPKNNPEAEQVTVIAGEVDAGATEEVSAGRFAIDFTAMHELDPNQTATGVFYSEYDIGEDGVAATAAFEAFADGDEDIDALYAYDQRFGGEGSMDLGWLADATGNGEEELHVVRSRWLADGQGRADIILTQGQLGDEAATASECWNDQFAPVYRVHDWLGVEEGEVAECAFAEPEYNEEG
ncbi:MAG: hypothetical protein H6739_21245 [Alphaproteobacteria bacterium]|nr:hypothetical protein [Alphaproteobacteria bacterium]